MPTKTMKKFYLVFLIAFIISCSDDSITYSDNRTPHSDQYFGISILNDGPRGSIYTEKDSKYTDSIVLGKNFAFRCFRTRIINDTIIPIELQINFSKDSVSLFPKADRYLRVFLFPDELTPDTIQEIYNFGIRGLESFLDTGLNKPTTLTTLIKPKGEYILYIGILFYPPDGLTRAGLFINGHNYNIQLVPVKSIKTGTQNENELTLVFGIGIDPPHNYSLISCGRITFIK